MDHWHMVAPEFASYALPCWFGYCLGGKGEHVHHEDKIKGTQILMC